MKVVMPYIGGVLSVNDYKVRGKGGVATNKTKRVVEIWMGELAEKVRGSGFGRNLKIELFGHFYDDRAPDLHNLHKVIGDAVKEGLVVDDKEFKFIDLGYDTGHNRPTLDITLTRE